MRSLKVQFVALKTVY